MIQRRYIITSAHIVFGALYLWSRPCILCFHKVRAGFRTSPVCVAALLPSTTLFLPFHLSLSFRNQLLNNPSPR